MILSLREMFEFDPQKKDYLWGQRFVMHLRYSMIHVVNDRTAALNRELLYGNYDTEFLRDMFKNKGQNTNLDFSIPMAIMEKIRNIITAEIQEAGIDITLNAVDVTANSQRERDKMLLRNRKDIENLVNELGKGIVPEYKLSDEEKLSGKKLFSGDIAKFDQLGLSDQSDDDVNYFFSNYYRLFHEIFGEEAVNFFIKYNELQEMLPMFVDDMMSVKTICMQQYVDDITGAIKYKYLYPESVRAYRGKKKDFSDAAAIGWEEVFTVSEVIEMLGEEFDFQEDMNELLSAVNFAQNSAYTCVMDGPTLYYGTMPNANTPSSGICNYDAFLKMSVKVGYVEWKSQNANTYKIIEKNFHNNVVYAEKKYGSVDAPDAIYKRTSRYRIDIYKAYYFCTGINTQRLFKFGILPYQRITGMQDEYSSFSISVFKERGQSITMIARPHIRNIEKAYKKFEFMVNRAKPPGRLINYDGMVKIAQALFPSDTMSPSSRIKQAMALITEDSNELYTTPEINGVPAGGGGPMNYDIQNGLSKSVMDFMAVIDTEYQRILDNIGFNQVRSAYSPKPREVNKLQEKAINYSEKATSYLRSGILRMIVQASKVTLAYVQDIIKFKDIRSLPYMFLLRALGDDVVNGLDTLNAVAFHRYGIFVESFNTFDERQRIMIMAMQAFEKGEITAEQLVLIENIRGYKRAAMAFAYEKKRKEKRENEMKRMDAEYQNRIAQEKDKRSMQLQLLKNKGEVEKADRTGQWAYRTEQLRQTGAANNQYLKNEGKQDEINAKTEGGIRQKQMENNLQSQQPVES